MGDQARIEEFTEYAAARQNHLLRTAYLLCGDWHGAQDLTQTALLNLCKAWNRARRADSVDAYAQSPDQRLRPGPAPAAAGARGTRCRAVRHRTPGPGHPPRPRPAGDAAGPAVRPRPAPGARPGGGGPAVLGGPERGGHGRRARLLDRQRQEPVLASPGQAPGAARRRVLSLRTALGRGRECSEMTTDEHFDGEVHGLLAGAFDDGVPAVNLVPGAVDGYRAAPAAGPGARRGRRDAGSGGRRRGGDDSGAGSSAGPHEGLHRSGRRGPSSPGPGGRRSSRPATA